MGNDCRWWARPRAGPRAAGRPASAPPRASRRSSLGALLFIAALGGRLLGQLLLERLGVAVKARIGGRGTGGRTTLFGRRAAGAGAVGGLRSGPRKRARRGLAPRGAGGGTASRGGAPRPPRGPASRPTARRQPLLLTAPCAATRSARPSPCRSSLFSRRAPRRGRGPCHAGCRGTWAGRGGKGGTSGDAADARAGSGVNTASTLPQSPAPQCCP